jgi:hypothetical protein
MRQECLNRIFWHESLNYFQLCELFSSKEVPFLAKNITKQNTHQTPLLKRLTIAQKQRPLAIEYYTHDAVQRVFI